MRVTYNMVNYDGWINLLHVVLNCNGPEQVLNSISGTGTVFVFIEIIFFKFM